MDIKKFEESFEELRRIGKSQANYPPEMREPDLAAIATILNLIAAETALVIQSNLEIWKLLEKLVDDKSE